MPKVPTPRLLFFVEFPQATRQYGANPRILMPKPVPGLGCAPPTCCDRYIVPPMYRCSFHIEYPPNPATSCASPPLISAPAAGVGETLDAVNGNPHAGVLFQRSSTVGLLLNVTPNVSAFPNSS